MCTPSACGRAVLLFVCLPLAMLALGSGISCPSIDLNLPAADNSVVVHDPPVVVELPPDVIVVEPNSFGIDLVNDTSFQVDPSVSVDEFLLDLGTLTPLEGSDVPVAFDVDCLTGDTLTIDPVLFLSPGTSMLAANGPLVLHEGVDYVCGDILTLQFSQDRTGTFFVDVAVNGVLITPPVVVEQPPDVIVVEPNAFGIDLVNDTSFQVDPSVSVDGFLLDLGTLTALEGSDVPVAFDVDCLTGDNALTIDPVLFLAQGTSMLAANGPLVLHEGVDYVCGDILTLQFSQDGTGTFFVDVAVNGVFITF